MTAADPAALKDRIIAALRTVHDPEIPVNIYDLGLIYGIEVDASGAAAIRMTLTSPNCPVADKLPAEVQRKARAVEGISDAKVELTFDPPWSTDLMTEEAKIELSELKETHVLVEAITMTEKGPLTLDTVLTRDAFDKMTQDLVEGTRAPMPWRMLLPLTLGAIALGSLFGAQEVATVATADDAGNRAASGLMLAAFAAGSLLSGVVAGAVHWQRSPLSRARVGMWLLAAGALTIPLLSGLVLVSVALFVTGLAVAPTLIAIFSVVEAGTPRSRLNEAMGFLQTGVGT